MIVEIPKNSSNKYGKGPREARELSRRTRDCYLKAHPATGAKAD